MERGVTAVALVVSEDRIETSVGYPEEAVEVSTGVSQVFHLHLVSDATGETTHGVTRACLAQFEGVRAIEHLWPMVRNLAQIGDVVRGVEANPGVVVFTLVNQDVRRELEKACARLKVPCISVLDPVIQGLAGYFGTKIRGRPGLQHMLDANYFHRIDAMQYALSHDDAQLTRDLGIAEIILVGVSRTSKTPTSMYLAHHWGIRAANVPIVPNVPLPEELFRTDGPLIVGLTASPDRLVQIRRNRLLMLKQEETTTYVDIENVKQELLEARKLFAKHGWPVIDVTRRSIEETASAIYQLYAKHREKAMAADESAAG